MIGFLCVDKPEGVTSRLVVNRVYRHAKPAKVGHAGTLDPLATGVLVVAVGRATKLISHVQRMEKRYSATFELGKTSDTEDITGAITEHEVADVPGVEEVEAVCRQFVGEIQQQPPAYSALRVDGKRAYKLAREGKPVELQPRPVTIHEISLVDYDFPKLRLDVRCGSGTYIRSLGRDIGEQLRTGAVMTELRRTAIGEFSIANAIRLEELDDPERVQRGLEPVDRGVSTLPSCTISEEQKRMLSFGVNIELDYEADEIAAFESSGNLAAVLQRVDGRTFRPAVSFIAI